MTRGRRAGSLTFLLLAVFAGWYAAAGAIDGGTSAAPALLVGMDVAVLAGEGLESTARLLRRRPVHR